MKILAIGLTYIHQCRKEVSNHCFNVKETKTGYKVLPGQDSHSLIINCRSIIRKDEVNKVFFDESLGSSINERRATLISLKAWVVISDDDEDIYDEILANYKNKIKNKAIIELDNRL